MTLDPWPPLTLLPGWDALLAQVSAPVPAGRRIAAVRAAVPIAAQRVFVADAATAARMVDRLSSSPVAAIAVDSEYRYGRPAITLKSGKAWRDPASLVPLLVSLAAWLTEDAGDGVATYVLDVRVPEVVAALRQVLRLPVPLVAHHLKAELHTFWALGLDPDLGQVYDTMIAAAALDLGRHGGPLRVAATDAADAIVDERLAAAQREGALSLKGLCRRYGIVHPYAREKDGLRASFLEHPAGAAFTDDQVAYAAADADATLQLYAAQRPDLQRAGLGPYLETTEFPFVVANARIEWGGVPLDRRAIRRVQEACRRRVARLAGELAAAGIANPGSRTQLLDALCAAGLGPDLARLARGGRVRLDQEALKQLKTRHRVPGLVLKYRDYVRLASEEWLLDLMTSEDGRLRPSHDQLRAATGRNACSRPALAGIPWELRPLVKAGPGRAIVELDYGQMEVGIAAAEHEDAAMIAAYNTEDVYAGMAQRFYADELTPEERALDTAAFRAARPDLRKQMKTYVLAVIFNKSAQSIAAEYRLPLREAEARRQRFFDTFPSARDGIAAAAAYGLARGYAYIRSGPRRHVRWEPAMRWKAKNAMINTPIQGAGAVIFKNAVVALDKQFRGTTRQIIMIAHDAVVIECDQGDVEDVARDAVFIMAAAFRALYPAIRPKVGVNREVTSCWNKEGDAQSVADFLVDAGIHERDGSLADFLADAGPG